jgi:hypothetical protein
MVHDYHAPYRYLNEGDKMTRITIVALGALLGAVLAAEMDQHVFVQQNKTLIAPLVQMPKDLPECTKARDQKIWFEKGTWNVYICEFSQPSWNLMDGGNRRSEEGNP